MTKLSHQDDEGRARMVDVGGKPETPRRAVAGAAVRLRAETLALIHDGGLPKGDALGVARIAGIMGAKLTPQLIPLCHPLPLDHVAVDLAPDAALPGIRIRAEAATRAATGVEMEALTAAAVAALALIDMVKAVDREACVTDLCVLEKEGGRSGRWKRADPA
jgi:cyclic pyranopterin phosphate synthase